MTHRNEFPAEHSLAGCSPAEPAASASAAALILNQKSPVRQQFSANGNCPLSVLSEFAAQCSTLSVNHIFEANLRLIYSPEAAAAGRQVTSSPRVCSQGTRKYLNKASCMFAGGFAQGSWILSGYSCLCKPTEHNA